MHVLRRFFQRLATYLRLSRAEHDLSREIRAHLQLLEDRFTADGLTPEEARHRALRAFGGVEQVKEHQRDARSFRWLESSRIDLRLGARMLAKYPGLAVIGGAGLAVAIAIATSSFAFFYSYIYGVLPFEDGDRVVALENWDVTINNEMRQSMYDFVRWQQELRTVTELGAFRIVGRNLIVEGRAAEPVRVAEMTASALALTRVPPILGRSVFESDERPGAAPVLVLGYEEWQARFGGDRAIAGRTVRLGNTPYTVIGVMPEGFKFPINHSFWTAMTIDPPAYAPRRGPGIFIIGRLADGVSFDQAQAELAGIGARAATELPATHANLRPQVLPYAYPILDIQDGSMWELAVMQGVITLLLIIVAVNVGILVYARTATRYGELVVRTALGASRGRIVGQLFLEALVLSVVATAFGLLLARVGLVQGHGIMAAEGATLPYWVDYGIPTAALVYTAGLALLAAVIAGVLPALRATAGGVSATIRDLGGAMSLRLGRTWTLLVITQVAVTVAGLPIGIAMGWSGIRSALTQPAFAIEQYLAARFTMDAEPPPGVPRDVYDREQQTRIPLLQREWAGRIEAEPNVMDVTLTTAAPGMEPTTRIEVDGRAAMAPPPIAQFAHVAADYFDAFDVPLLTGRMPGPGDANANVVVVNRTFVERVLNNDDALGRRVRYAKPADADPGTAETSRWYEIVGVVGDLHANPADATLVAPAMYHPLADDHAEPLMIVARVRGGSAAEFSATLRTILTSLDPTARLTAIPFVEVHRQQRLVVRLVATVLILVTISVLMLSAAGIYALMSFAVTQRRKEIGIRAAMGADARQLLWSIFSRSASQLGVGVLVGAVIAALLDAMSGGEALGGIGAVTLPAMSAIMVVVGLMAALGPARRGLQIQPTEALRE